MTLEHQMTNAIHGNVIGGEWVDGASSSESINPSDLSDVVGVYARADEKYSPVQR